MIMTNHRNLPFFRLCLYLFKTPPSQLHPTGTDYPSTHWQLKPETAYCSGPSEQLEALPLVVAYW